MRERMNMTGLVVVFRKILHTKSVWIMWALLLLSMLGALRFDNQVESNRRAIGVAFAGEKNAACLKRLSGEGTLFEVKEYDTSIDAGLAVEQGEVDAAFVFAQDWLQAALAGKYRELVTVIAPRGMNLAGLMQEQVYAAMYETISAEWFASQVNQQTGGQTKLHPEQVLAKLDQDRAEGLVFQVEYVNEKESHTARNQLDDSAATADAAGQSESSDVSVCLSVHAVAVFFLFMAAYLGAAGYAANRQSELYQGHPLRETLLIAEQALLLTATFLVSLIGGWMTSVSVVVMTLMYVLVLLLWSVVAGRIIRAKWLRAMFPFVMLAVLLCSPLVVDLREVLPLTKWVGMLFPMNWIW